MRKTIWFTILIIFAFSGCLGRKSVLQKYYLLELPADKDSVTTEVQPLTEFSCKIAPVEVHAAFASSRIALRTKTHELNYYAHHKWAMRPGESLTSFIEAYFRDHNVFTIASSQTWEIVFDYEVQTRIEKLEVVQQDDKLKSHMNIEFYLVDNVSGEIVVVHNGEHLIPLQEKDLNLFASTISASFHEELNVFSEKITVYLLSRATDETSKL